MGEEVRPVRTLVEETKDATRAWKIYDKDQLGLPVISLENLTNGIKLHTPVGDLKTRIAALQAWAGARHSRSPDDTIKILKEIHENSVDADKKLETTYKKFGHASVADMAALYVHFSNAPLHFLFTLFNWGEINSGQEKSTRFQANFGNVRLPGIQNYLPHLPDRLKLELEVEFQSFREEALRLFATYKNILTHEYEGLFHPKTKGHASALETRVLDSVRGFLPMGLATGMCYQTSARDWGRKIALLRASPIPMYRNIGEQVYALLVPSLDIEEKLDFKAQSPGLVKHADANPTTRQNLEALRNYLESSAIQFIEHVPEAFTGFRGYTPDHIQLLSRTETQEDRMAAQYIAALYPSRSIVDILWWLTHVPENIQADIGSIIMSDYDDHNEMSQMARTTNTSTLYDMQAGEIRDLNRHRAQGRTILNMPQTHSLPITKQMADQIMHAGFGLPKYVTEIERFHPIAKQMERDFMLYYTKVREFVNKISGYIGENADHSFILALLPSAHKTPMVMHSDPRQGNYFSSLRKKDGNHINNRVAAWETAAQVKEISPYYRHIDIGNRPKAADREEFFSRK